MKDISWYFLFRVLLGVGVLSALVAGIIIHEGPAQVAEDLNDPMTTADMIAFAIGIPLGLLLDNIFAAGVASYIVWGEVILFSAPIPTPRARPAFR